MQITECLGLVPQFLDQGHTLRHVHGGLGLQYILISYQVCDRPRAIKREAVFGPPRLEPEKPRDRLGVRRPASLTAA